MFINGTMLIHGAQHIYINTFILTDTELHDVAKGREAHQSSTGLPKLYK